MPWHGEKHSNAMIFIQADEEFKIILDRNAAGLLIMTRGLSLLR